MSITVHLELFRPSLHAGTACGLSLKAADIRAAGLRSIRTSTNTKHVDCTDCLGALVHLAPSTELTLPGSPKTLCGLYPSRDRITSRVNTATCPDCSAM